MSATNSRQPKPQQLALSKIRTDGGTQLRCKMDDAALEEFAEALEGGASFPPVVVFFDGAEYWLADGFHRYEVHQRAGKRTILAIIHSGTLRDAKLFAAGANAQRAIRLTREDKRRIVFSLLEDEEWGKWSDSEIARQCHVTHPFVGKLRATLTCNVTGENAAGAPANGGTQERTYTTKHGTPATMIVSNIGKVEPQVDAAAAWHERARDLHTRSASPEAIARELMIPLADVRAYLKSPTASATSPAAAGSVRVVEMPLRDITIDLGLRVRVALMDEVIEDYAQILDELPPAVVYDIGDRVLLADGFYRAAAHQLAGRTTMRVEVRHGSREEAFLFAMHCNDHNGLYWTRADRALVAKNRAALGISG